ncbi:chemokine (C-C motif) ligand 33, duplicate 3 [Garra rufa]|uniref:chemokine (C-C motif) ligand 33, duplicate 3 n=1 Tax=Garra rufa TaxID=137080 RepID=UPI003CCEAE5D
MRASSLCLGLGLVLLMAWTSEAQPGALAVPERCCFNFIDFAIPPNKIVTALKTGSHCPVAGVVVATKKGLEFCVKPDEAWIKKVIE